MLTRSFGNLLTGVAFVLLLVAAPLRAADYTATTWQELIDAVGLANADLAPDTISLEDNEIAIDSTSAPLVIYTEVSIINGILNGSSASSTATCCVLVTDLGNATFDQLTIQNCRTSYGAVVVERDCTLSATDCVFDNNESTENTEYYPFSPTYYGGAITDWEGDVVLTDCLFTDNHAIAGGAVAVSYPPGNSDPSSVGSLTATDCTFAGNSAEWVGGAIVSEKTVQATNCLFTDNTAGQGGGAIAQLDVALLSGGQAYGSLMLSECGFSDNAAQLNTFADNALGPGAVGGAVVCIGSGMATKCLFTGNQAYATHAVDNPEYSSEHAEKVLALGGALATVGDFTCSDCAFSGNSVFGENTSEQGYVYAGGGAWVGISTAITGGTEAPTRAVNCTFYNNSVTANATTVNSGTKPNVLAYGGGVVLVMGEIYNCILWDNLLNDEPDQLSDLTENEDFGLIPPTTVVYSDIQGGWETGIAIIDADPLFVDAPDDLSLGEDSPCIDTGFNDIVTQLGLTTDLAGNPRIVNGVVDMGAYEFQSSALILSVTSIVRNGRTITVRVQISNPHETKAYGTTVTAATLNGSATNVTLPLVFGMIKPGASKQCTLQFKNVAAGEWPLTVEGACSLGLLYLNQTVTVP